ncbi:hypothetical protein BU17DRAFT_80985 [Hysterangium stoloniferum]|nr:hypothetical protein BU17DRAFT_80985 [Hysterangium stoloniferum]
MPSTSSETGKLQPNISRLGEAFKVLSDELPRLSNLDAFAILDALQDLRTDIQSSVAAQEDLGRQLNKKLTAIHDTLISLERRVVGLEGGGSSQFSGFVRRTVAEDRSMPAIIEHEKSTQPINLGVVDSDEKAASATLPPVELLIQNKSKLDLKSSEQLFYLNHKQEQGIFNGPSGALIIIIVTFIPIILALTRPEIFDGKAS